MARIPSELRRKLERKLGVGTRQVYERIQQTSVERGLPRHLAALALAMDAGINVHKYVADGDWPLIRRSTAVPVSAEPRADAPSPVTSPQRSSRAPRTRRTPRRRGNTVHVVHGRNLALRNELFVFLRSLGLRPVEWNSAVRKTKKGSPYTGEILDAIFSEAVAVVVLLTPDDEARLRKEFLRQNDADYERNLTGQPRPNVLFEAGMAYGRRPDSVVIVEIGSLRPVSNLLGRHVVKMDNSPERRKELATKLENAGCAIDDEGTDWLSAGDFTI